MTGKQIKLKSGFEVFLSDMTKRCECGETITFAKTAKGKFMPVSKDYHGEWETHFKVCPLADKLRKGKGKK